MKSVLYDTGIRVAGSHTGLDLLTGDKLKESIIYNQEIENNLLICPYLPEEKRNSDYAYKRTAEELNKIGQVCKESGMTFAYHNHNFEFESFNGMTGFELLFTKNQQVEWLVVEQEDFDRDPMDCAKINQDNLRTLL